MKTINIDVCDDADQLISIECKDPNKVYDHPYCYGVLISPSEMKENRRLVIDSNGIIDATKEQNKKNILVVYNTCAPYSIAKDTYDILKYEITSRISVKLNQIYMDSCNITFCNLDEICSFLNHHAYDNIFGNSDVLVSMFPEDYKFYSTKLQDRYKLISYVIGLEEGN